MKMKQCDESFQAFPETETGGRSQMYPTSILTEKGESRGLCAQPKTGPDNAHKSVRASTGAREKNPVMPS